MVSFRPSLTWKVAERHNEGMNLHTCPEHCMLPETLPGKASLCLCLPLSGCRQVLRAVILTGNYLDQFTVIMTAYRAGSQLATCVTRLLPEAVKLSGISTENKAYKYLHRDIIKSFNKCRRAALCLTRCTVKNKQGSYR